MLIDLLLDLQFGIVLSQSNSFILNIFKVINPTESIIRLCLDFIDEFVHGISFMCDYISILISILRFMTFELNFEQSLFS
jgi:hypothetical protein